MTEKTATDAQEPQKQTTQEERRDKDLTTIIERLEENAALLDKANNRLEMMVRLQALGLRRVEI